ncbi:uncharacterized protein LY89DRAFT_679509 [Mollisia scopiformis]|uniref:Uncharacterized protein n=1 Tax=Mollisia scopiformis TaxID=149040 RepID=A0A194XVV0_MOLSC|nr:uncharacterized protein LY89DRAFT_679509 [Mollisia scopiformis]KUJ24353.1 hypothetical protein LY89DRAFT_679509 [Mollisia scopiformis]
MQFSTAITSLFALLTVATAAPAEEKRQGEFFAVQTYYSAGGCTGTADSEATFNEENLCQPIATVLSTVESVSLISVTDAGCVVHYYTNSDCTEGDTVGVIDHCEQASGPFVATNVICS